MSAPAGEQRSTQQVSYDARRPRAVRGPGLAQRRGADAGLHERARRSQRTRETGELHLWSRSRGEQWHKGETSGNIQTVRALRAGLRRRHAARARGAGRARPATRASAPAFTAVELEPRAPYETLPGLERTLAERARERPAGSYTVSCSTTRARIGEKVMEEAEEVARAAREESDERVDEEAADVLYHLLVLLRSRGRSLADAERVLDGRRA